MPTTTYMVVDARHDHGFRVPRPDLAVQLGTPDACTTCHLDRTPQWAARSAQEWWGPGRGETRHFGQVLAEGRRRGAGSARALARLAGDEEQAAIVRATALALLADQPDGVSAEGLAAAATSGEPLLRLAAARAGEALPPAARWSVLGALLDDEMLGIRIEAARALAGVPLGAGDAGRAASLQRALDEYLQVQLVDAERPEAHVNLGLLAARLGDWAGAEAAYRRATRLGPDFQPAVINLADLYRVLGRDAEGLAALDASLLRDPQSAVLHHARGLALVRLGRHAEALQALQAAALAAPDDRRFHYVWAVSLASTGALERAIEVLRAALLRHPADLDLLLALTGYLAEEGLVDEALATARRLEILAPDDPAVSQLVERLRQEAPRDR